MSENISSSFNCIRNQDGDSGYPRSITRDEVLRRIELNDNDFVVDIGGGHRPFSRANLIIDKYPFEDGLHRSQPVKFPRVPIIKADASVLPIPNGGCDLLFSSHMIEHLPDPKSFVDEIKRCSHQVYLEFPSRNLELMFSWLFHLWLVEFDNGILKFYRNDLPQFFGQLFHGGYDAALGAWSDARHEHLNTSVYCRSDELECEYPSETATEMLLRDSPLGHDRINMADSIDMPHYSLREVMAIAVQSLFPKSVYYKLSNLGARNRSPVPLSDGLLKRLMCPHCRDTTLRRAKDEVVCECGSRYSEDRGIFDFVVEAID